MQKKIYIFKVLQRIKDFEKLKLTMYIKCENSDIFLYFIIYILHTMLCTIILCYVQCKK